MTKYELFKRLLDTYGVKTSDVARATGITTAAFTQWKQGKIQFKEPKLRLIADYFNVPLSYFLPDSMADTHYTDPLAADLAQEMADRPGMRTLFAASRNLSEEDLQIVNQLVQKLTNK
jgi:repressor LexA